MVRVKNLYGCKKRKTRIPNREHKRMPALHLNCVDLCACDDAALEKTVDKHLAIKTHKSLKMPQTVDETAVLHMVIISIWLKIMIFSDFIR